ncbi:hypothetical protein EE612_033885 [Oryza sativa]|nr:hypothetical protein EE612_033885 [Oryza sativa]
MEALRRPEVVVNRRWSRSRLLPLLLPVARPSAPAPALEYGKICKEPVLVYDSRMPENVFDASKMIFFFYLGKTGQGERRGGIQAAAAPAGAWGAPRRGWPARARRRHRRSTAAAASTGSGGRRRAPGSATSSRRR